MKSDFLVIGSGIAGLSFALRVSKIGSVVLVTKKKEVDSATNLAQGGIAAVLDSSDTFEHHIKDTLESGAGICDEEVVKLVVREGPSRINDLVSIGVDFIRKDDGASLDLGKEGGHSKRRVAHSYDLTGREIERALIHAVEAQSNITVLENHVAIDLLVSPKGSPEKKCIGAYILNDKGEVLPFLAKVTTICSGGCGKVYLYTSNPDISTGDGVAMAFRAGAKVSNMEFIQFHPTCLYHPQAKNFLISEAVRGEGGLLIDRNGSRFMKKYDPRGELATRDTVARAIDREMKERGYDCVYLDITSKSRTFLQRRFPTIYSRCMEYNIDISAQPIPVVPAAHYMCGGIIVDQFGRSSIENLYVLGESANTGLHGGNRLASNSLLEAVVYAKIAADSCFANREKIKRMELPKVKPWSAGEAIDLEEEILINHNWDLIRRTMWNYVGIVRSVKRLELARTRMLEIVKEIEQHYRDYYVSSNMIELRNISLVAMLIIQAALQRKESRGLHYNLDYPATIENMKYWNIFNRKYHGREWDIELSGKYYIK